MKVLIACEFSGIVRDSFTKRGHDAISCDLLPTEAPGPHHQGDIFSFLNQNPHWDLMITHWECTYLCLAGVRWLYGGKGTIRDPVRWRLMEESALKFKQLLEWPGAEKVAAENPVMHRFASDIIGRRHDFSLQPWQHGHGEIKETCFHLRGLPPLKPTNVVNGRRPRVHHASPGPDRWKERSRTLPGIADAMAEQWGCL